VQPKLPILRRVPDLAQEQLSSEMKFIHTPSGNVVEVWVSNDPAKLAAEHAKEIIDNNPNPAVLGLPTGKTPIALYNRFIELVGQGWTGLNNVIGVQLDEYFGVSKFNSQSFYRFLEEQFFTQLPKESNAVHLTPADEDRIAKYDAKIEQLGGMLICFLGIGTNGHVAFNEPSKKLESDSQSRLVTLSPDTRIANFGGAELGYPQAITIGLKSILASKNIFLIANSENKIKALKGMLKEQSNPLNPASLLVGHTGLKIYVTPQIYNDLS
jgi:glucosamine-6-phosphate deaminase